jgi:hypothetical protein
MLKEPFERPAGGSVVASQIASFVNEAPFSGGSLMVRGWTAHHRATPVR